MPFKYCRFEYYVIQVCCEYISLHVACILKSPVLLLYLRIIFLYNMQNFALYSITLPHHFHKCLCEVIKLLYFLLLKNYFHTQISNLSKIYAYIRYEVKMYFNFSHWFIYFIKQISLLSIIRDFIYIYIQSVISPKNWKIILVTYALHFGPVLDFAS